MYWPQGKSSIFLFSKFGFRCVIIHLFTSSKTGIKVRVEVTTDRRRDKIKKTNLSDSYAMTSQLNHKPPQKSYADKGNQVRARVT
jgi:hypothetical protein